MDFEFRVRYRFSFYELIILDTLTIEWRITTILLFIESQVFRTVNVESHVTTCIT